jgi:hypothetical protein
MTFIKKCPRNLEDFNGNRSSTLKIQPQIFITIHSNFARELGNPHKRKLDLWFNKYKGNLEINRKKKHILIAHINIDTIIYLDHQSGATSSTASINLIGIPPVEVLATNADHLLEEARSLSRQLRTKLAERYEPRPNEQAETESSEASAPRTRAPVSIQVK